MERQVVNPFKSVNEEEAKTLLSIVERQKEAFKNNNAATNTKNEVAVIEKGEIITKEEPRKEWPKRNYVTHNNVNPFLGFCKKVFNFFRDNVSLNVNFDTGVESISVNKVEGKGKNYSDPVVTSKVNAGPINISFDTKNMIKNIDHKGGGIRTY